MTEKKPSASKTKKTWITILLLCTLMATLTVVAIESFKTLEMTISYKGLVEQLEYEGFTTEQAEYAASQFD